jgi:hypothetical protein
MVYGECIALAFQVTVNECRGLLVFQVTVNEYTPS